MKKITLIPGDGIGPEITETVKKVFSALAVDIEWEEVNAGTAVMDKYNTPLPDTVIKSISKNKIALKAPITTPVGGGFRSVNVALRKELNLYAGVRPVTSIPALNTKFSGIDLVIIRENTEGLYSGVEHRVGENCAESIKITTRRASERIAHFAFEYARKHSREKVTAVHKANILKETDGLFLECSASVAEKYPEIEYEEKIVDNMCMQLVLHPEAYDILLLPNLYGDIVSDLGAGLIGGLGVCPGANFGEDTVIFEAVHGSAPDIAGRGIANPLGLLRSALMMLEFIEKKEPAQRLNKAIAAAAASPDNLTPDLNGRGNTEQMTEAIVNKLRRISG